MQSLVKSSLGPVMVDIAACRSATALMDMLRRALFISKISPTGPRWPAEAFGNLHLCHLQSLCSGSSDTSV